MPVLPWAQAAVVCGCRSWETTREGRLWLPAPVPLALTPHRRMHVLLAQETLMEDGASLPTNYVVLRMVEAARHKLIAAAVAKAKGREVAAVVEEPAPALDQVQYVLRLCVCVHALMLALHGGILHRGAVKRRQRCLLHWPIYDVHVCACMHACVPVPHTHPVVPGDASCDSHQAGTVRRALSGQACARASGATHRHAAP